MSTAKSITAVIVLYQRAAAESESFASLECIFRDQPSLQSRINLVLYDNSPVAHALPLNLLTQPHYVHDSSNSGLAAAYNYALQRALILQSEWLLLLDQDTTLTAEYIDKLLTAIDASINGAAIVPILEMDGRIYSPELDFFYHLRHQFPWARNYPLSRDASGEQTRSINAYNSGAAFRVKALEEIGGFPTRFRMDYLDHAVFRALQQKHFKVFVLPCVLQQKLSHIDLDQVPLGRHSSVLVSQSLFVRRYGSLLDRLLYRVWLLRKARHYRLLCKDERVWQGMVRQALGLWRLPGHEDAEEPNQ